LVGKDGLATPVLTVAAAGKQPLQIRGAQAGTTTVADFGVFQLDRKQPQPVVLFRSFTGGAHCCIDYKLASRENGRWRVRNLGSWDGSAAPQIIDVDGDGRLELVAWDQRFLYQFDSYAGSVAPPVVYELAGGQLIDVSTQARYRPAFASKLAAFRSYCEGQTPNGACAGYVATAARVGEATPAFAVLDLHTGPGRGEAPDSWSVPEHCGATASGFGCKKGPAKSFETLHQAVEWFLQDLGYLPKSNPQQ
jgi:hypothetical protein